MRTVYIFSILFMIIFINTAVIKKISNKEKRSVYYIISNVDQNITKHVTKHLTELSMLNNDLKEMKYEDLKNIFNLSKKEKKHIKIKNKKRRKDIKNHFLGGIRAKHSLKLDHSKKENVIVNFYFLTKLL